VKNVLIAITGGILWFFGGVTIHSHFRLSPLLCLFGGLTLGILASKAER
jgi:hypothetical protein